MKNIKIYILVVLVFTLSCDDKLNIEPRQVLDSDLVWVNEENLEAVLFGAYAGMKGTFGNNEGGEMYGGDYMVFSEMLAATDEVVWGGSFTAYREVFDKEITVTNTAISLNWIRAYDVINSVNNVLAHLDLAETDEKRDWIEGQALAIRGIMYFELLRFWAQPYGTGSEVSDPGVPLVLTPTITVEDADALMEQGRSTVAAGYQQVLDDLLEAKGLIDVSYGKNGTSISTYTVSAVLSRVYLQRGEFALAAQEADRVIQSGEYTLGDDPIKAFNNVSNGPEDVFTIQQTALSNSGTSNGGLATFYARLFGSGRGDVQVQATHFTNYETGDLRSGLQDDLSDEATAGTVTEMYYIGVGGQNSGQIQCAKYQDSERNIQIVRLPEMYLTRAEANFEAGTNVGATPLADINAIRNRAGLTDLTTVTIDEIRLERMRELAFEGHKLHDIKRWQMSVGSLPYDANELVLPIPQREIEIYDIPQNAGY
ncbi:RagB/SusD family nutrient uptake outer membrane protein [Reichenbachiella ulvae]|uniref:RagB/SusD family nutrient uptake outer membrane protein n=1 Tax=Reichenbachiella ulvae TaxID=2980104 RepID=A0ABT3CZN4_9BACT|nr:RagB/SusD family nutrient uptake outer membrane protein [Reichenbachiella ulvae]MCV9389039.1 RagB/SusD family nutrient uptake outer membrane protein [Reichenbachiella ulvae]